MLTVFMDRTGNILYTCLNLDLRQVDRVKLHGKIYLIVQRIFSVDNFRYEVLLHESEETETDL